MSDAIEAAAKALISAQRDMFRGGGWFALDDAKTLVSAAITAYEAAKGGGGEWDAVIKALKEYDHAVVWHSYSRHNVDRETEQHKAAAVLAEAVRAALTSPASGERGAVIEECAKVAEAEELTGDAPPHFTQREIDIVTATVRSTARSIAAAIRALEGK